LGGARTPAHVRRDAACIAQRDLNPRSRTYAVMRASANQSSEQNKQNREIVAYSDYCRQDRHIRRGAVNSESPNPNTSHDRNAKPTQSYSRKLIRE
jgi:hypothetical protein